MGSSDDSVFKLVVDGIQCPTEFTHLFTPFEFEELVYSFNEYDITKSGHIMLAEMIALCRHLDYTISPEAIDKILQETDGGIGIDDNGMVHFEEACRIVVMAKTCQEGRINHITQKLTDAHTTTYVELYKETKQRSLRVKFQCLDIRETSDVGLPVHLSEVPHRN